LVEDDPTSRIIVAAALEQLGIGRHGQSQRRGDCNECGHSSYVVLLDRMPAPTPRPAPLARAGAAKRRCAPDHR
jgi:hypothetical protein